MGIKERRTKLLLILFLLGELDLNYVELTPRAQEIFDLPLNYKTKSTLRALIKAELISSQEMESATLYALTKKGIAELALSFPYVRFLFSEWDGRWRIVSYEIPEKRRELRDRFRREVSGWGLGPWHRSFWITPHPIVDNLVHLVEGKEEAQYIQAFESSHTFGDRKILIEKVWSLDSLERAYRDLFKHWHLALSKDAEKVTKLKEIMRSYVDILRLDPGLPKEVVGNNWIGFEAFGIFREIKGILLT